MNGDGFDDLIVGAPYTDPSGNKDAGRAYLQIYSPSENRFVIYFTFNGENAGDRFGWAVSTAGDVNGDGFDDVVIGAPWNDQGGKDAGKVYVYSGRDGALVNTQRGERAGDLFGYALAGNLRLSGDGRDDFIIGAPNNDDRGSNAGKVYLYAGGSYAKIATLAGERAGDQFGRALARVGKANGDAWDDFAVGAPFNDDKGADAGKTTVFNGKSRGVIFSKTGARAGDRMGWSLSGTGRSNDDGFDDLVVGSPYFDVSGRANAGRVQLFSGRNGKVLWTVTGDGTGDLFGYAVSGIGDVNGSGSGDALIGAPNSDVGGTNTGRAYVYSGGTGELLTVLDGEQPGERFGWSVSGIGDVNGDFLLEVTVGASQSNNGSNTNAGTVYLLTPE